MILLDTNVISEAMRPVPDARVLHWLDLQARSSFYLCSTVWSELLTGIELMPHSKRKTALRASLGTFRLGLIETTVLAFDEHAATFYAKLVSQAQSKGFQISVGDAQIAAIALMHGMTVATRDIEPFLAAGAKVLNPWTQA
jgi:predicted nucleic acid-binding protein